ncbi:MAG: hypothetical protein BWY71_02152 [Planctomycetes bacterium ADurb.Bin412]|nr:MAG: hypothetical protein BWY71_02152 [Planctomycetes bacterium ADurb.Bin412]
MDRLAVSPGGSVDGSGEKLVGAGVINNAHHRQSVPEKGNRHGKIEGFIGVIAGSINRVDHPPERFGPSRFLPEKLAVFAFFADKTMAGAMGYDFLDDEGLAVAVGLGDNLVGAFVFGRGAGGDLEGMLSGGTGGFFGDMEQREVIHWQSWFIDAEKNKKVRRRGIFAVSCYLKVNYSGSSGESRSEKSVLNYCVVFCGSL